MLSVFALSFTILTAIATDSVETPCTQPEARQFDFWVGAWDLTWQGEKGDVHGKNTITALYDQCVIKEEFQDPTGGFRGMSVSVYDTKTEQWRQTWVDNKGGYLDFVGGFKDGRMILSRSMKRNSKTIMQRMVWHNIKQNSLDWNWERSDDVGKTWKLLWQIHYNKAAN